MKNLIKKISLTLSMAVVLTTIFVFPAGAVNTDDIRSRIIAEYSYDEQFQLHKSVDIDSAAQMIDRLVEIELRRLSYEKMRIDITKTYSCAVPKIKQTNTYNCGPTSALQALKAAGVGNNVNGSTDSAKIAELSSLMGTSSSNGTLVYKICNGLNDYLSTKPYVYTAGSSMTLNSFGTNVIYSLNANCAPILHAKTNSLAYYNGANYGHAITIKSANKATGIVVVSDCHFDDTYYGEHNITMSAAYNSITKEAERYLIHG